MLLPSLRHPLFRLLILGQAVSILGTWMQGPALRWMVLEIKGSPFYLGILGAVTALPLLLFSLWGGSLSDRLPRTSVLIMAHLVVFIQACSLGLLTDNALITFPLILSLAFLFGSAMAFEVPARQALIFDLVGKDDIVNAVAVHSFVFNLAQFMGPAIAGLLIAAGHTESCFYLKAASTLFVLIIIFILKATCEKKSMLSASYPSVERKTGAFPRAFAFPFEFARKNPLSKVVLLIILSFSILLLPYSILIPSITRDMLGLGAREFGFISSANGVGALTGATVAAIFGHRGKRERWWWTGTILFPFSIICLSMVNSYLQALLALFITGFSMVITSTSAISLLQLQAEDEERGKVMGAFTTSFMGFFPLGSLVMGGFAQITGLRETLFAAGSMAFIFVCIQAVKFKRQR